MGTCLGQARAFLSGVRSPPLRDSAPALEGRTDAEAFLGRPGDRVPRRVGVPSKVV